LPSLMHDETLEAATAVAAQAKQTDTQFAGLTKELRHRPPAVALTVARGSSDHAANYFAYLAMQRIGIPVTSLPMSLFTLHAAKLKIRGQLALAISQSGRSPDLVATMASLTNGGATTLALVNQPDSPLARNCEWEIPLCAGPEKSVAATKSYIAALAASARLVAHWQQDQALLSGLEALPDHLRQAARADWSAAVDVLKDVERVLVVGRGLGLAVAMEAALKLKETSAIQAEAFSGAEVRHGPMALVGPDYPVLIFAPRGPEQAGLIALADEFAQRGAKVLLAAPDDVPQRQLTLVTGGDEALDPLLAIQSFYLVANQVALARGFDPDAPRYLAKITRTL
jgi:glucosamine--fructose-6-phosphate aminotransferase (isomerizing)